MASSDPPSNTWKRHPRRLEKKLPQKPQGKQINAKQQTATSVSAARLLLVWAVAIAGCLGIAANLYQLQIVRSPELSQKARRQQMVELRPFVPRRSIVDRNRNAIAIDQLTYTLYAHPKLFKTSPKEVADKLAPILNRSSIDLVKRFRQQRSGIPLAFRLRQDVADQIIRLRTDGLEVIEQYSRLYPHEELAAEVVGYVDINHRGQAGIEYSQEKLLERATRAFRVSRAGDGSLMPDRVPEGFLHFDDLQLQLTIDNRLQRAARIALQEKIQEFKAKRGAVIVMDAQDGSLLALVSEPSYNPNQYFKSDVGLFKNWTLADLYEPGSTFKPLNVAIALEAGVIKPNDVFNDSGTISVGGWQIKNAQNKSYGTLNIAQILQNSSNIGMVQIIQRLKPATYYGWLEKLGLGQTVGIDLPFESPGQIKNQREFTASPIEPAAASYGQGFSLTPIQLVTLHASLANGGKLVTPHVVKGLFDPQGQMHWQPTFPTPRPIFSPTTSQTVLEMMETVVTQGTGKAAQIPGYRIGGKTGTAQKASSKGGYLADAKITSFVGIMPIAANRRYVVLAVVEDPDGVAFGSTVAAPIVKAVMESLITIQGIPPSQK